VPLNELLKMGMEVAEHWRQHIAPGLCTRSQAGNIMLTKAGAKLMDFGLAKPPPWVGRARDLAPLLSTARTLSAPSPASPLTTAGSIVGTIQYMSPEQIEGKEADARSDILPSARCSTRRQPASARFRAKARSCSFGDFGKRSGAHQRNQAARAGGARLPGGNLPRERP